MTMYAMTCAEFDDALADYLEGDLGPAQRQTVEAHLGSCARCAALARDLQQIRAGSDALGELAPSRDLWTGIAARIEAPVVPLGSRTAPNVAARPRRAEWLRMAAVAAALVAVTAGVTYTLTVNRDSGASGTIAAVTRPAPAGVSVPAASRDDSAAAADDRTVAPDDSAPVAPDQTDATSGGRPSTQSVGNSSTRATSSSDSREIDRLRTVFLRNRSQLDPRTAAIIEANLKVIDDAIAQSKAALAQDPASRFLNNQLNNALDKKLELLRTAAQLPSRT
jgi:anti-sigma factor RsiW